MTKKSPKRGTNLVVRRWSQFATTITPLRFAPLEHSLLSTRNPNTLHL